ncbi:MAG: hypothetical protein IJ371_00530 [Clostridia bacterium]|nr:hypothetical protein [Clostridia bacterium]
MNLIQKMIEHCGENRKIKNNNLYYGYVVSVEQAKYTTHNNKFAGDRVICKQLSDRQRSRYLKGNYRTFIDSENCELIRYLAIERSNIQYFKIPSRKNKVMPYISADNIEAFELFDDLDGVLVCVQPSLNDTHIFSSKISIKEIRQMEKEL